MKRMPVRIITTYSPMFRRLLLHVGNQMVELRVNRFQNGVDSIGLLLCQPVVIGSHLSTDGQGFNET